MSFFDWLNSLVKKMNWIDMSFVKVALIVFGLMIASIWPVVTELEWYWYLIIWFVLALKPMIKVFSKKKAG